MIGKAGRLRGLAAAALAVPVATLLGASLYLLVCAYIGGGDAFDSDSLYPSDLCADIRQGRPLTGWHLPGAPYLFPDVLLLLPCQLLPRGLAGEFMGYCVALWLATAAAIAWLGCEVGMRRRPAFLVAASGTLLLVAAHLGDAYGARAAILVCPGSHAGIIPVGLVLLALGVRLLRRGFSPLPVAAFLVLGGLGAFSDKLLLVQFLAPLAAAAVLLACGRVIGVRAAAGLVGLAAAVAGLCSGLRVVLTRLGFHLLRVENGFGAVRWADLRVLLGQVGATMQGQYLVVAALAVYLAAGVVVVAACLRRRETAPARREVLLATLAVALVPGFNLAALFLTGSSSNPAVYRYTLPVYLLPALLGGWLLALLPGGAARLGRAAFVALAVVIALWRVAGRGPELAAVTVQPPYPPLARALDRLVRDRGPIRGLAEFWTARRMRLLTHECVAISPLDRYGIPFLHAANPRRWLADDLDDTSVPRYSFIVVQPGCHSRDPGPGLVGLLYGVPCERVAAGDHEIWLYERVHSAALDRFLCSRVAPRLRQTSPGIGPASPACLSRPKNNMTALQADGNIHLGPAEALEVRFAGPVSGRSLDIAAGHDDWLDLEFYAGPEKVGVLQVPQVPVNDQMYGYPGLQARLLALPLRGRAIDRVVVRPRPGMAGATLGHLLVRPDEAPDTGTAPAELPPRARLEAEWLPTFTGMDVDLLAASTPDPHASGGRVREAAADFAGVVTFTAPLSLPAGRYRLEFALRVADNTPAGELASVDVLCFAPQTVLAARSLTGGDFPARGEFVRHSLMLDLADEANFLVFRVLSQGKTSLAVDYIDVLILPEQPSAGDSGAPPSARGCSWTVGGCCGQ
jgi:hypothetical protein